MLHKYLEEGGHIYCAESMVRTFNVNRSWVILPLTNQSMGQPVPTVPFNIPSAPSSWAPRSVFLCCAQGNLFKGFCGYEGAPEARVA
jgi:hypothetical protein